MLHYDFTINGVDFKPFVERDSYNTSKIPVYSDSIVTMDGVEHLTLLRNKGEITFSFNPQNAANTQAACNALLVMPCEVYYFNLQTQQYELAIMRIDQQSARFLSYCLAYGLDWNQMTDITLTEL